MPRPATVEADPNASRPAPWPPARADGLPHVKICGIASPQLAASAADAGADFVGLVHFAKSPRHLPVDAMAEIAAAAKGARIIVLTVNADDETLDAIAAHVTPFALQLHGKESPDRAATLARRYGVRVMKALGIAAADDVAQAAQYEDLCLFDAKPPKEADRPGGLGKTFDWSLIERAAPGRPYMLSGGLDPKNVAQAVGRLSPYAVDVSSGVETAGRKDPAKIAAFIAAARSN